jgi:hypothetical protein
LTASLAPRPSTHILNPSLSLPPSDGEKDGANRKSMITSNYRSPAAASLLPETSKNSGAELSESEHEKLLDWAMDTNEMQIQSKMPSTLEGHIRDIQWYEKMFPSEKTFYQSSQIEIMSNSHRHAKQIKDQVKVMHIYTRFRNIVACLLLRDGTLVTEVDVVKKSYSRVLHKQVFKDQESGNKSKFVDISHDDIKHCTECVLERFDGKIPFWDYQRITICKAGLGLGKRWGELFFIAPASSIFTTSGKGYRRLHLKTC